MIAENDLKNLTCLVYVLNLLKGISYFKGNVYLNFLIFINELS